MDHQLPALYDCRSGGRRWFFAVGGGQNRRLLRWNEFLYLHCRGLELQYHRQRYACHDLARADLWRSPRRNFHWTFERAWRFAGGQPLTVVAAAGSINVTPSSSLLSGLTCASNTLLRGTITACNVSLSAPAAPGGATIQLSSSSAAISIPTSVTAAAGSFSASFQAVGAGASSDQSGTISASLGSSSVSFGLSFSALPSVQSLQCGVVTLLAGTIPACSVTLTKPAYAGGRFSRDSTERRRVVPHGPRVVSVPAGQTTATFSVIVGSIAASGNGSITASLNGSSQPFAFTWGASWNDIGPSTGTTGSSTGSTGSSTGSGSGSSGSTATPPQGTISLTCTSPDIVSGSSDLCTVTFSQGAPQGGAMVIYLVKQQPHHRAPGHRYYARRLFDPICRECPVLYFGPNRGDYGHVELAFQHGDPESRSGYSAADAAAEPLSGFLYVSNSDRWAH